MQNTERKMHFAVPIVRCFDVFSNGV